MRTGLTSAHVCTCMMYVVDVEVEVEVEVLLFYIEDTVATVEV